MSQKYIGYIVPRDLPNYNFIYIDPENRLLPPVMNEFADVGNYILKIPKLKRRLASCRCLILDIMDEDPCLRHEIAEKLKEINIPFYILSKHTDTSIAMLRVAKLDISLGSF